MVLVCHVSILSRQIVHMGHSMQIECALWLMPQVTAQAGDRAGGPGYNLQWMEDSAHFTRTTCDSVGCDAIDSGDVKRVFIGDSPKPQAHAIYLATVANRSPNLTGGESFAQP
jgi:hypothetical protein